MKKVLIGISVLLLFLTGCKIIINPDKSSYVNKAPTPADLDNNKNNMSDAVVKSGDKVKVDYAGWKEDGTYFDTSIESVAKEKNIYNPSSPYKPLEFVVGAGKMIKGFDKGVLGMKIGEKKTIKLQPEEAYGEKKPEMMIEVPVGSGQFLYGEYIKVELITGKQAKLDFNMPLAGKDVVFDLKVIANITNPGSPVGSGDVVSIDYTIRYDDGKIFDSTIEKNAKISDNYNPARSIEPLDYSVGKGGLIGVDKEILGMKEGESKAIELTPSEGFGEYDYSKIGLFDEGEILTRMRHSRPKLDKISETGVIFDFNHELAGQILNFEITLVDIVE